MAAKRSDKQLAPIGLFVKSLYALGGYASWKEFAEEAAISAPQVSDFKNATVEPAGLNLLKLIQATARRREDADVNVALRSVPPDRLARLEEVVAELAHDQALILDALGVPHSERALREALAEPLPDAPPTSAVRS